MKRGLGLLAAMVLGVSVAHAQSDGDFSFGDMDWAFDVLDDPLDHASDLDLDFEADDIIGLNLGAESLSLLTAQGFRIGARRRLPTLQLMLFSIRAPLGLPLRKALGVLRALDPGGFYDSNVKFGLAEATAPTSAACEGVRCYGHELIGWPRSCDARVRIGIVDSAVNSAHPALAGRHIEQRRFARGGLAADHGTAIATQLAGAENSEFPGLLPQAELFVADVFSTNDDGTVSTDTVRLVTGLDWIASQRPAVVNLSIAGPESRVLAAAVRRMQDSGITLVAAAGNLGPDAPPQYPAAYPDVIAVTAIDRRLNIYPSANRGDYLSVAAPGVDIWTPAAGSAGVFRQGTSYAAPYVTAAVALESLHHPDEKPAALREALQRKARDLGEPGFDPVYGWGLVQAKGCRTGAQ
ncbi:MAG: S8 family serine peptidase [Sinimarinibacterium sp.]|jgi:hypothetical protein